MTAPMRCREAVERLWGYLDDELDELDHEAIEQHLRFCLRCCGELAFAREVRGVLATARPHLPDDAHERLSSFIELLDPPPTPDARNASP